MLGSDFGFLTTESEILKKKTKPRPLNLQENVRSIPGNGARESYLMTFPEISARLRRYLKFGMPVPQAMRERNVSP